MTIYIDDTSETFKIMDKTNFVTQILSINKIK